MLGEAQNQFSFNRGASSTTAPKKSKFLSVATTAMYQTILIFLLAIWPPTLFAETSFSFFSGITKVAEGATSVWITVEQTPCCSTMAVDYFLWSTNAVAGRDFISTNGTLEFQSGPFKNFTVNLIDNEEVDPPRTIFINLTNLPPGVIITNPVAQIEIVDDDGRFDAQDASFPRHSSVSDLLLTPDQKMWFGESSGAGTLGLLNQDGSLNSPFPILPSGLAGVSYLTSVYSLAFDRYRSVLLGLRDGYTPPYGCGGESFDTCFGSFLRYSGLSAQPYFQEVPVRGKVYKVLVQPDGKIVFGGKLQALRWDESIRNYRRTDCGLLRVLPNGEEDLDFRTNELSGFSITNAVLDSVGGIIGIYEITNSAYKKEFHLGRWDTHGSRDNAFESAIGTNLWINYITPVHEDNSKFIIAVQTEDSSGGKETELKLISINGGPLPGFNPPRIKGLVNAVAFDRYRPETVANGAFDRILVGGAFGQIGNISCTNFVALAPDGAVLWTKQPDDSYTTPVGLIKIQLDGAILIDGVAGRGLIRLKGMKAEGWGFLYWEDSEFRQYENEGAIELTLIRAGSVNSLLSVNMVGPDSHPRLGNWPDNLVFNPGETRKTINIPIVNDSVAQGVEHITFTLTNAIPPTAITRASARAIVLDDETPGTRDSSFLPPMLGRITALAEQADGKILASYLSSSEVPIIVRLDPDGSLDPNFQTNTVAKVSTVRGYAQQITDIQIAPSGKIYVAGGFTNSTFNNNYLVRLNPEGALDSSYIPAKVRGHPIIRVQPDGKLIVGSTLSTGGEYPSAWRLTADGKLDQFNSWSGILPAYFNSRVSATYKYLQSIFLRADGAVVLCEATWSSSPGRFYLTIFDTNGVRANITDPVRSFRPLALSGNDLLVLTNSSWREKKVLKLNLADLSLHSDFEVTVDRWIESCLALKNGQLIIAGPFTRVNGIERYGLARINPDGTLDQAFTPGEYGLNFYPTALLQSADDSLLAAGTFNAADLVPTSSIVRLHNHSITPSILIEKSGDGLKLTYSPSAKLQVSTDLQSWSEVPSSGTYFISNFSEPTSFYRVIFLQLGQK